jgi:DNA topoisomerase-1
LDAEGCGTPRREVGRATPRRLARAVESVAWQLGNTAAVCRKSYVHPAVLDAYLEGSTIRPPAPRLAVSNCLPSLNLEEKAVRKEKIA